ncbi:hypothetical protein CPB83DRAFT_886115 [Crepidotus variabilis]|uniref:H-type lectin domain-containing protein n=1 Tax=Crepidotus variabilis TaxID=179855 RepID=A0A9P6E8Y6_9AGAR|nr:hypothetical protein CPB83DRAFT_886115 [Crepidotus variabilis]
MPIVADFDSQTIHPPNNPQPDTQTTLNFPETFVARPRLPHGFRALEVDKSSNIRVKSTNQYFTRTWADCHITTWDDTNVNSGIDDTFVLAPADMDFQTGEHMRNLLINPDDPVSIRVNFEYPFITSPKVLTWFNYIDLDKSKNWRLKTTATDVDVNGFTLNIEATGDTILYTAQACWLAYPEDRTHIWSASVSTTEVHPVNQPQTQTSKAVTFGNGVEFWKNPNVFVALNSFDIGCQTDFRIKAAVDNVTQNGLTWHIDTWGDTTLYSASASIIAINP